MNFEKMAADVGLEMDEFQEMVELFVETCAVDLGRLHSAVENGDVQEVIQASHSIKGASGNLGFMEIYGLAQGLEAKARNHDLSNATEIAEEIRQKIDLILEE